MEEFDLEKGFVQMDMEKMKPYQVFIFLTPYIERAGFSWKVHKDLATITFDGNARRTSEA
jgi:hypothetical protein